jgi:hypothetical protein
MIPELQLPFDPCRICFSSCLVVQLAALMTTGQPLTLMGTLYAEGCRGFPLEVKVLIQTNFIGNAKIKEMQILMSKLGFILMNQVGLS